jgi:hypothetical protein
LASTITTPLFIPFDHHHYSRAVDPANLRSSNKPVQILPRSDEVLGRQHADSDYPQSQFAVVQAVPNYQP